MKKLEQKSPIENLLHQTVDQMDKNKTEQKLQECQSNIKRAKKEKEELEKELEKAEEKNTDPHDIEIIKEKIAIEENIINDEKEMKELLENHKNKLQAAA